MLRSKNHFQWWQCFILIIFATDKLWLKYIFQCCCLLQRNLQIHLQFFHEAMAIAQNVLFEISGAILYLYE